MVNMLPICKPKRPKDFKVDNVHLYTDSSLKTCTVLLYTGQLLIRHRNWHISVDIQGACINLLLWLSSG